MSKFALLLILLVSGCASGKSMTDGLIRLQGAETIKGADTIKVADKVADKVEAKLEINPELQTQFGMNNSVDRSNKDSSIKAGGNVSTASNNDSAMITELNNKVLDTYKELTNEYIELMKYIIYTLFGAVASALASLISLVIWIIKFLLNKDSKTDDFMQEQLEKK